MLVVNFFGGPDAGKSTMAAAVFANLKFNDINCECVQEYAKDKVWEESYKVLDDQIYVFGKQQHRLKRLFNKVDVILMDSPILLSIIYDSSKNHVFRKLVIQEFNKYKNLNFFLNRRKEYNQAGRVHTLKEAIQKDQQIKKLLENNNVEFKEINSGKESTKVISSIIKQHRK